MRSGTFRFGKDVIENFHYKNLSGEEKATFDILLDIFVKREASKDAVFCIDEPELHVAVGTQGRLITTILDLLSEEIQLWIATHSIGIVREVYRIYHEDPDSVVFLDFFDHNFDTPVELRPSKPNRSFWSKIYEITLDDLASLVAPERIVLCEGNPEKNRSGFDAECYNALFAEEYPETLFVSRGGSNEVIKSEHLKGIIAAIAEGTKVDQLIDRNGMTDERRNEYLAEGILVLGRKELEEYLYDPEVLRTFLESFNCDFETVSSVLNERTRILEDQEKPRKIRKGSQELFNFIKKNTDIENLGRNRDEFISQFLVPALKNTDEVFRELRKEIFESR